MRRDRVDLLLIHDPDTLVVAPDVADSLEGLRTRRLANVIGQAWGGFASGPPIGNVVQQRYPGAGEVAAGASTTTAIYHGLLRAAASRRTALASFAEAYARNEQCGFLFSASSPAQIEQVAGMIRRVECGDTLNARDRQ